MKLLIILSLISSTFAGYSRFIWGTSINTTVIYPHVELDVNLNTLMILDPYKQHLMFEIGNNNYYFFNNKTYMRLDGFPCGYSYEYETLISEYGNCNVSNKTRNNSKSMFSGLNVNIGSKVYKIGVTIDRVENVTVWSYTAFVTIKGSPVLVTGNIKNNWSAPFEGYSEDEYIRMSPLCGSPVDYCTMFKQFG